jgi:threonine/homoserine efflux transporter RhtA
MLAVDIGSIVVGAMLGTVALAYFAYFVRELHRGRVAKAAPAMAMGVLVGTAIISAPLGHYVLSQTLWPWYCIGEGIPFMPAAFFVAYRYALLPPPVEEK